MKFPVLAKILSEPITESILARANNPDEAMAFMLTLPGKGSAVIEMSMAYDWHKKFELMKHKDCADQIKHGLDEILTKLPKEKKVGLDVQNVFEDAGWKISPMEA